MAKDYVVVMDPMGGAHLEHKAHKYTKRERIGDKWRYWYDTAVTGETYKKQMARSGNEIGYRRNRNQAWTSNGYTKVDPERYKSYNQAKSAREKSSNYWDNKVTAQWSNGDTVDIYNKDKSRPYGIGKFDRSMSKATYNALISAHKKLVDNEKTTKQRVESGEKLAKWMRSNINYNNKVIAEESAKYRNAKKGYEKSLAGRIEKGKKTVDALLSKLKKKVNDTAIKTAKKLGFKPQQTETRTDISTGQKWRRVNGGAWEKVR